MFIIVDLPEPEEPMDDEVLRVVHAVVVQADVVCLGHACVAAVEAVDLLEVWVRYLADVLAYLDARDDGAVVLLNGGELVNAVEDGGGAAGYEPLAYAEGVYAGALAEQLLYEVFVEGVGDRKSTRLNSSHLKLSRMPSSA